MPFVVFEVETLPPCGVAVFPIDPRDGPVESSTLFVGCPVQAAIAVLSRLTLPELAYLKREGISAIQRKVAGEQRAAEAIKREAQRTGVVQVAEIQREFDQAVAEEQAFAEGIWREDHGEGARGPIGQGGGS